MYDTVKVRKVSGTREARWGSDTPWRTLDEATGLPEVREDQFWRVVEPRTGSDYMRVELHQRTPPKEKKTWRGKRVMVEQPSTVRGWTTVAIGDPEFGEDSVLDAALYILRDSAVEKSKSAMISKLVGDYPPKRLKEV